MERCQETGATASMPLFSVGIPGAAKLAKIPVYVNELWVE
jgi:hypothetical protein